MPETIPSILGVIVNWGRWREIVAIKLPNIMSESKAFENILSIRVLEWLVILIDCKIKVINELEVTESKNSYV